MIAHAISEMAIWAGVPGTLQAASCRMLRGGTADCRGLTQTVKPVSQPSSGDAARGSDQDGEWDCFPETPSFQAGNVERARNATFAANLRRLMLEQGLALRDLASKIGVSHQSVSQWLNAQNGPTNRRLAQTANALGVPIERLILPPEPGAGANTVPITQLEAKQAISETCAWQSETRRQGTIGAVDDTAVTPSLMQVLINRARLLLG